MKNFSKKWVLQTAFFILLVSLVIYFLQNERAEVQAMMEHLAAAKPAWIAVGILLTGVYVWLQALMYRHGFRAIGADLPLRTLVVLFLKRNLAAVFLPGGGVISMAMFTREAEAAGIAKPKIHFASSLNLLVGFFTVLVVAVPVLIWLAVQKTAASEWLGFVWLSAAVGGMAWVMWSLRRGGFALKMVEKWLPNLSKSLADWRSQPINLTEIARLVAVSMAIEAVGIVHLWIAMKALDLPADWGAAAVGYVAALLALTASPIFKGLGATEAALAWALTKQGFSLADALATTVVFRLFEFWIPLALGFVALLRGAQRFLLRAAPPVFLFALGVVNVLSAVTPALPERVRWMREFLSLNVMHYSNFMVLTAGLALLLTSIHLARGLKMAWWLAVGLTTVSMVGHLVKGFDFEETLLGGLVLLTLLTTRRQYILKNDRRKGLRGLVVAAATVGVAFVFGTLGFYFLDVKAFGLDLSFGESVWATARLFCLFSVPELIPKNHFAQQFLSGISAAGMFAWLSAIYFLTKTRIFFHETPENDADEARLLVEQHGSSPLDYFKTYAGKRLFFTDDRTAFVAYKVARNFAFVLETPVAPDEPSRAAAVADFEKFARKNGWRPVWYRVQEESLQLFQGKTKKQLLLGQEAIVDLSVFKIEGNGAKQFRNAINRAEKEGFTFHLHEPPVNERILQQLQAVSSEWLADGRQEAAFAGGIFNASELAQQTIATVETKDGKILVFANLVPDFAPKEATYDLIRRTHDAPGIAIDFLMTRLLLHLKSLGFERVNLGLAPLAGLETRNSLPERALQLAASRLPSFHRLAGLRAFKEKFATGWTNQYLVYENEYDLIGLPAALAEVERV